MTPEKRVIIYFPRTRGWLAMTINTCRGRKWAKESHWRLFSKIMLAIVVLVNSSGISRITWLIKRSKTLKPIIFPEFDTRTVPYRPACTCYQSLEAILYISLPQRRILPSSLYLGNPILLFYVFIPRHPGHRLSFFIFLYLRMSESVYAYHD